MTSVTRLYGLDRPDELADLKLKDASQEEIIEKTFDVWLDVTEELYKEDYTDVRALYKTACRIIRPFGKRINGHIRAEHIPSSIPRKTNGLYLSALLNETDVDVLSVNKLDYEIDYIGWRMRPGKAVVVEKDGKVCWMGHEAQGGTVVILGDGGIAGYESSSFNCINLGGACVGSGSSNMTFINYGHIHDSCGKVTDGMLIEATGKCYWKDRTVTKVLLGTGSYCVELEEISSDLPLQGMLEGLESASKDSDIPNVNDSIHKVDSHIRNKYARKVA